VSDPLVDAASPGRTHVIVAVPTTDRSGMLSGVLTARLLLRDRTGPLRPTGDGSGG
jgi:hypothetical protein